MAIEDKYQERLSRINKAIRCEPVDQIPLIWQGTAAAPKQMGLKMVDFIYNPLKGLNSQLDYMDRLGVDGINNIPWSRLDVGLSAIWFSRLKMPGRELEENEIWQVDEKEMMSVDDYDTILDQGFEAFMGQFLPKVIDLDQLEEGMSQTAEFNPIMFAKMKERGYPGIAGGATTIPFETLCGGRSMMSFIVDLHRMPDKIQAVMDTMMPMYIDRALSAAENSGIRGSWVGGWRTASAMLAPKLWDRFVFPYIQQVVHAMAEQNIISVLHLDQDWTRDLNRFLELPAKKCVMNLDGITDIRKAKEVLGDHMAIMGDVHSALLTTDTPESVQKYVKELIEDIGTTGILLCPGCDAPIDAKHENIVAMYEAGREFSSTV